MTAPASLPGSDSGSGNSPGNDMRFFVEKCEAMRNFANKIWNASRFAEMNECVRQQDFDPATVKHTVNKWIIGETELASKAVTQAIEAYKFNEAASSVYECWLAGMIPIRKIRYEF